MHSKPLVTIHKYVALSIGLFIALMGLSGAGLVFKDSIENSIHPERQVRPIDGQGISWERIFRSALVLVPDGELFTIKAADETDRAFEVFVEHPQTPRRLYVDPYTGRVITDSHEPGTPIAILFRLHTSLLSGNAGKYIVAVIGVSLIVLSITGFILWWPRTIRAVFRIRWGGGPLAVNYDLHRVAGTSFALLLLLNATTGVVLLFSTASGRFVDQVFGSPLRVPVLPNTSKEIGTYRSLDEIVAEANRSFAEGRITRLRVPMPSGLVIVQKRIPDSERHPYGMNRIFVDPYTATVLKTVTAADNPPGIRMFGWVYPLHIGEYFGKGQQVLWIFLGVTPLFMLITGITVWWKRRRLR